MRMTLHVRLLLTALLDHPDETYGFELARELDLLPGTVYPILRRFETTGWVTSRPETNPPDDRPPRTYYQLTRAGQIAAHRRA